MPAQGSVGPGQLVSRYRCVCACFNPRRTRPPAAFVCEDDVRMALKLGKRIAIGDRTIVTPAARDIGEAPGVLHSRRREALSHFSLI